ncbi:MAG: MFS transporter [Alistipes sp.]
MTETIHKKLNDSAFARWTALILIALMMLFGYMFVDMMSPLQSMLEVQRGWTPDVFGLYGGSEFILNVFGFLIVAGIILDKMGIRFTGELSASLMFIGACVKYYAISDAFTGSDVDIWLSSFWVSMPASAKLASLGFMVFGCGCEMAGITVSKAIAKWFEGKEMALAMGLEMAIARVGVFAIFSISPILANMAPASVVRPVAFCAVLLLIGLITFTLFCIMDRKLDRQIGEQATSGNSEEAFRVSDIGKILSNKVFWIIALLCVLYYSAIFPFQRFATNMLESNLGISAALAADIFRWFPMGAAAITPFLGSYLDHKGKGASMLIFGAVLMITCHLTFAFILPAYPSTLLAYGSIVLLGISFSLVPAALWPSVPKIIPTRYLGSAYSLIFWIQNMGLCIFPLIIGYALKVTNVGVAEQIKAGVPDVAYNYTVPMLIFASCGAVALLLALLLKREDAKKKYGLELPNIKE